MENSDFLWDCAFIHEKKDRQWIIPDQEDFLVQDSRKQFVCEAYDIWGSKFDDQNTITSTGTSVRVLETRKYQGVLDIIGGEVWEAALLLSSYLFLNQDKFVRYGTNLLELGSGIGLPSLLLTNLYLQESLCERSVKLDLNDTGPRLFLTLSDFESSLLLNLQTIIEQNYQLKRTTSSITLPNVEFGNRNIKLNVLRLDWTEFPLSEDCNSVTSVNYDYVIGSALCYAPFHADCLSRVIQ